MTDKPKMAPRGASFQPAPEVIPKADFVALAELAYRATHTASLARQMGETLIPPVSEKSCQRWLDKDGPNAPAQIVAETFTRADRRFTELADILDRTARAIGN